MFDRLTNSYNFCVVDFTWVVFRQELRRRSAVLGPSRARNVINTHTHSLVVNAAESFHSEAGRRKSRESPDALTLGESPEDLLSSVQVLKRETMILLIDDGYSNYKVPLIQMVLSNPDNLLLPPSHVKLQKKFPHIFQSSCLKTAQMSNVSLNRPLRPSRSVIPSWSWVWLVLSSDIRGTDAASGCSTCT